MGWDLLSSEPLSTLIMTLAAISLSYTALWFIGWPPILIGAGIALYKRKWKFFLFGLVISFLLSYFVPFFVLLCCVSIGVW